MKKLNVTPISDSAKFPIKKGTLQFLQDANIEAFKAIMIGLIGPTYSTANVYIIRGANNTGAGANFVIAEGAAFYDGEIFLIDAVSFSTTGTDVPILNIATTQYTTDADPVTFTDNSTQNVHDIRKIEITAGPSGTGIVDYSQVAFLNFIIPAKVNLSGDGVTGAYPNYEIAGPNGKYPILYVGSAHIGDVGDGGLSYNMSFSTVGTANYVVSVEIESFSTSTADATLMWSTSNKTDTGFTITIRSFSSFTQNITINYTLTRKS